MVAILSEIQIHTSAVAMDVIFGVRAKYVPIMLCSKL
jgi:hypothetical protein